MVRHQCANAATLRQARRGEDVRDRNAGALRRAAMRSALPIPAGPTRVQGWFFGWKRHGRTRVAIRGIGVDVVKVDRISESLERFGARMENRLFTAGEASPGMLVVLQGVVSVSQRDGLGQGRLRTAAARSASLRCRRGAGIPAAQVDAQGRLRVLPSGLARARRWHPRRQARLQVEKRRCDGHVSAHGAR